MNKSYILYNMREAKEQMDEIISGLENNPDYDHGDFFADMSHLYHHINTAWNARDESESAVNECSEDDFNRWRAMPSSEELLVGS